MGIGFRLKELLRDRKITIKQLSEDTGIPLNTLYSITKRDSERADQVIIQRIATALGVPMSKLVGEAPDLIPGEFNAFANIIERAGFCLCYVEDEGRYSLNKEMRASLCPWKK